MAKNKKLSEAKIHPWRLCPSGQHAVRTHPLNVPPSKRSPVGSVTTRHFHCAHNPSGKDKMEPVEMEEIAEQYFLKVKNKPCATSLKFKNGTKYDNLIAGWTRYWNDVLKPKDLLKPNLIKALIASESGFDALLLADKKNQNSARGLMQITNKSRKILANEAGELREHFVSASRKELNDPNANICAGVRWLFRKRDMATGKLGRQATWEEAVAEYKGIRNDLVKGRKRAKELIDRFEGYLGDLEACKKNG